MILDFPKLGKDAYGETRHNRYDLKAIPYDVAEETLWTGNPMTSVHYAHGVVVYEKEDVIAVAEMVGLDEFEVVEFEKDSDHWFLKVKKESRETDT